MRARGALLAGTAVLTLAWLVLPSIAAPAFSLHMTVHLLVVAVAAPLLALALAGGRYDPVPLAPGLLSPLPASLLELVLVWGWHTPLLHQAARAGIALLVLEQLSFLLAGLALWLAAFGGDRRRNQAGRRAAGIGGLLFTAMHMSLLGVLLTLAGRPLYHHAGAPFGLNALQDQQLGGVLMLGVSGLSCLAGALGLLRMLLREPEATGAAD